MTSHSRTQPSLNWKQLVIHLLLLAGALVYIFPLIWMVLTSLKPGNQVLLYPPRWLPDPVMWQNFPSALSRAPWLTYLQNSLLVTVGTVVGTTASCSVIAYAFAKLRFPGRNALFLLVLSTLMLPDIVRLVPTFLLFKQFGWINTLLPLIVPRFFGDAFYIFLLRQFFATIPNELLDAARMDGASEWRILRGIVLPLSIPALTVVAIFSFQTAWNDFLWPLVFIKDPSAMTLTLGLYQFRSLPTMGETFVNELMAATVMMTLPMILVFAMFQRYFVQGISLGGAGIKG